MRLQPCESDSRFSVQCLTCGVWKPCNEMTADLDGPAYRAYYCADHTPVERPRVSEWHITQLTPEAAYAHERRIRNLPEDIQLGWTPYNFLVTYHALSHWACHTEDELYRWLTRNHFDTRGPQWSQWENGVRYAYLHKQEDES